MKVIKAVTMRGGLDKPTSQQLQARIAELEQQRNELSKAALQVIWQVRTQHMATNKTDAANKLARTMARLEYIAKAQGVQS
jgi:hypothetical protein